MNAILSTVIPVFALIALGYGAGRFKLFTKEGEAAISLFVFTFSIPAFLFRTLVRVEVTGAPWDLWATFFWCRNDCVAFSHRCIQAFEIN